MLEACGAVGPSDVHGLLRISATDPAWRDSLTVTAADQSGELTTASEPTPLRAPFEHPATEETIRAFSEVWAAERHADVAAKPVLSTDPHSAADHVVGTTGFRAEACTASNMLSARTGRQQGRSR